MLSFKCFWSLQIWRSQERQWGEEDDTSEIWRIGLYDVPWNFSAHPVQYLHRALVLPGPQVHHRLGSSVPCSVTYANYFIHKYISLTQSNTIFNGFQIYFRPWMIDRVCRKVNDATTVMIIVVLLFVIPAKANFWCFRSRDGIHRRTNDFINIIFLQTKNVWCSFICFLLQRVDLKWPERLFWIGNMCKINCHGALFSS